MGTVRQLWKDLKSSGGGVVIYNKSSGRNNFIWAVPKSSAVYKRYMARPRFNRYRLENANRYWFITHWDEYVKVRAYFKQEEKKYWDRLLFGTSDNQSIVYQPEGPFVNFNK